MHNSDSCRLLLHNLQDAGILFQISHKFFLHVHDFWQNLADNLAPVLIVAFGKPAEKIVIKEINEGEDIAYYRDENDVHYVPKRKLADIILKK